MNSYQPDFQRAVSHSAPGSREDFLEKSDLSTTKFKGRVILGIGEQRISNADSESESSSESTQKNPYLEYRKSMKQLSKSSMAGAKVVSEQQTESELEPPNRTFDTDSNNSSFDGNNKRDPEPVQIRNRLTVSRRPVIQKSRAASNNIIKVSSFDHDSETDSPQAK